VNDDGVFDLIALRRDGALVRISDREKGKSWDMAELARLEKKLPLAPGETRLFAIDLDSNGAVDLVLRTREGGVAWLADRQGGVEPLGARVPPGVADVVSLESNEHLDLLGWDKSGGKEGPLARHATRGTKGYHWQRVKPRANRLGTGEQR